MSARKSKPRKDDADDPQWSDTEWEGFRRTLYEQQLVKPKIFREQEAERRKAGEPPLTLMETVAKHLRSRPRARRDTLALSDDASSLDKLHAIFTNDPAMFEIGEVAALEPIERVRRFGWLLQIPYDKIDKLPPHFLTDDFRWDWPEWAVKGVKYDQLRNEKFVEILGLELEKKRADAIIASRKYDAKNKRGHHLDEVKLTSEQKATLRRLRVKVKNTETFKTKMGPNASAERVTVADRYIESARGAVRQMRIRCGLPGDEVAGETLTATPPPQAT